MKHLIVPLDCSRFSESALPLALGIQRRTECSIELVTVRTPAPSFAYEEWDGAASEWTADYLDEVADRLAPHASGPVTRTCLDGSAGRALTRHVEAGEADLIIMATHGRGPLSRAWLGSVADYVLRHTDRTVLLARPDADEPPPVDADFEVREVLIPVDGSELSHAILEPALTLGSLWNASLRLVRIVLSPAELPSPYLPHTIQMNREIVEQAKQAARSELDALVSDLRDRGHEVSAEVHVGAQAATRILDRAHELGDPMIALATHGYTGVRRALLGSTTDKVIRGARGPVLVRHPE